MRKKVLIKHPLFLFIFSILFGILGIAALMLHLERLSLIPNYINAIIMISITVLSCVGLILFFKNLGKILKQEEKTKLQKITKNAFNNKSTLLIQKRCVVANMSLIIGGVCVYIAWIIFIPIAEFNSFEIWLFRGISILITILASIFSFITPRKMLVYKNGKLHINTSEKSLIIKPSELIKYEKTYSYPKEKILIKKSLFCDVFLYLENEKILLKKADCDFFLKSIIKTIKDIELKNENIKI